MSKLELRGFYLLLGFIIALMLLRPNLRKEQASAQDEAMNDIAKRLGHKRVAFEKAESEQVDAFTPAARINQTRNIS